MATLQPEVSMPSRLPVVRMHLVAAATALFNESAEQPSPQVERAAQLVDDALEALDAVQAVDVRPPPPTDWLHS